ncbi:DNA gyrase subunit B [Yinghuangia sp. ASG 101]|uniref:DNA gyrase subunit B n=1 Tax=Yinghuangia sp. ASG 101 TaxID=2896848 RepID=UPI001E55E129|nr:DNA gyrase subunit B [Yinghuangia sp. ASG 101]UGQ11964.1 DNA gyrase subunit B [Yinghuangia sp. ASG 101]
MNEEPAPYDAKHIQVMDPREAIRKRPGMYVGSTSERGVREMVFGVVGRAVNEVSGVPGQLGRVDVTLVPEGGVRVADNSPGVGVPDLAALLTQTHSGAGPGGRHEVVVGFWGMGMFVPNALSSRMTAEVRRDGVRWTQEFARGVAATPLAAMGPSTDTGTTLTLWPDDEIFGSATHSFEALEQRLREIAFLNRGLEITLADRRQAKGEFRTARYRFPDGVRDFVAWLSTFEAANGHADVIGFAEEDLRREGLLDVAMLWRDAGPEHVLSFANCRPTPGGGAHVQGLRDGLVTAFEAHARTHGLPVPADGLSADRVSVGLTAVVSVRLDTPEFLGATNDTLGGTLVRTCVADSIRKHLGTWLDDHPERAAEIINRAARRAHHA